MVEGGVTVVGGGTVVGGAGMLEGGVMVVGGGTVVGGAGVHTVIAEGGKPAGRWKTTAPVASTTAKKPPAALETTSEQGSTPAPYVPE